MTSSGSLGTLADSPGSSIASKRLLPWLVAVAFFMESLDTTILNTAVPAISAALHVGPLSMKAVLASYTLSLAVFIPISGWGAARFGTCRGVRFCHWTLYPRILSLRHIERYPSAGCMPRAAGLWRLHDGAGRQAHLGAD